MWGIIGAIAKQGISYLGAKKSADAQNEANAAQDKQNLNLTQQMIGTLAYRVDQKKADITRNKITAAVAINKAVRVREGESAVSAAQMGAEGRRVEHNLAYDAQREGANKITEGELTEEIELRNATNEYTDRATNMVDAFNNSRPLPTSTPDPLTAVLGVGASALNAYTKAPPETRAKIRNTLADLFRPKTSAIPAGAFKPWKI